MTELEMMTPHPMTGEEIRQLTCGVYGKHDSQIIREAGSDRSQLRCKKCGKELSKWMSKFKNVGTIQ